MLFELEPAMPEISLADITALLPYLLIGFLAQAVDGALGMAFGVIVNTILVGFMGLPPTLASTHVHIVKCFTSAASGLSHHFAGNIDFRLFIRLLFPGAIGGIIGAFLLSHVHGNFVQSIVLGYLLLIGIWLLIKGLRSSPETRAPKVVSIVGGVGGFLDAIGGGGWGPVVTSNLLVQGAEPRKVVGTVNSVGLFITDRCDRSKIFSAQTDVDSGRDCTDDHQHVRDPAGDIIIEIFLFDPARARGDWAIRTSPQKAISSA